MVSSDRSPAGGIRVRAVRPDDVMAMGQSCYDSFTAFNQSVNIPPRLDFPNVEFARGVLKQLSSDHGGHGVIAEEESSGALMAAGFITPGSMASISTFFQLRNEAFSLCEHWRVSTLATLPLSLQGLEILGFKPLKCVRRRYVRNWSRLGRHRVQGKRRWSSCDGCIARESQKRECEICSFESGNLAHSNCFQGNYFVIGKLCMTFFCS